MIFFTHPSGDIAVIEDPARAEHYEARGYTRCRYAVFRAAWRRRDMAARAEAQPEVEREKTVGSDNVPVGFHKFHV